MSSVFAARPGAGEIRRRLAGWPGRVWVWLPAAMAVVVIAIESSRTFSAANTSSWLRPLFERYLGHINDLVWDVAHHAMRKSGHFLGYGAVCITFLRAWLWTLADRTEWTVQQWRWRANGWAVACTAAVASLDELHQSFLPSRTGQVSDVALDTAGGIVISALVWTAAAALRGRSRRVETVAA